MAKKFVPKATPQQTPESDPFAALLSTEEINLVTSSLSKSLHTPAKHFIAEMRRRLDVTNDEHDHGWATNVADNFIRKREATGSLPTATAPQFNADVLKLFYSPSLLGANEWNRLTTQDKYKIIQTGLKVIGPLLEARYRADNRPMGTRSISSSGETSPIMKALAPKIPAKTKVPRVEASPSDNIRRQPAIEGSVSDEPDTKEPTGTESLVRPYVFDPRILLTPLIRVPWREERIGNAFKNHSHLQTLLDLANLPFSRLKQILGKAKVSYRKFQTSLEDMTDESGQRCGSALALIFAPLDNKPGGLGLPEEAIEKLKQMPAPPSVLNGATITHNRQDHTLRIDTPWRLLNHYNPTTMHVLDDTTLGRLGQLFKAAGFSSGTSGNTTAR